MASTPRHHRQPGRAHRLAGGLLALLLAAGGAQAQDLDVTQARLSLLPGDLPGAGYFRLHNAGEAPVALIGADSDAFESVEMHRSSNEDGMASMHAVPELEIAPGETLEFAPKGYHLMFMKRAQPLAVGDEIEVVLEFEGRGRLPVDFEIVSPTSM